MHHLSLLSHIIFETTAQIPEVEYGGKYGYMRANTDICPRIQLPVSAQWSQRLYVKVQGKMVHKDMHKIVFQSN